MKYAIWCVVFGGITGHREGWNKDSNGRIEYETREEAQQVADSYNAKTKNHPSAFFRYYVEEV